MRETSTHGSIPASVPQHATMARFPLQSHSTPPARPPDGQLATRSTVAILRIHQDAVNQLAGYPQPVFLEKRCLYDHHNYITTRCVTLHLPSTVSVQCLRCWTVGYNVPKTHHSIIPQTKDSQFKSDKLTVKGYKEIQGL